MPRQTKDNNNGGLDVDDAEVAEALEDLDEKVAEVTAIERKLAEIDELEKKVARLKELEYELAEQLDEQDATDDADRPKPYRLHRPPEDVADDSEEPEDRGIILREYRRVMYQFSFIGIEFGVAVALGALGGRWLDNRWDTAPWMMLLGVALGLTAAGRDLYRLVKKAQKKSNQGAAAAAEETTEDAGAELVSARDEAAEDISPDPPDDKNGHSS